MTGIIDIINEEIEAENPLPSNVPILYSSCTGWLGRPFMLLYDFLIKLKGGTEPNFDELAQ